MPLRELCDLVDRMLKKQRLYFEHRDPTVLRECKDLERRVRAAVDAVLRPPAPKLFDPHAE